MILGEPRFQACTLQAMPRWLSPLSLSEENRSSRGTSRKPCSLLHRHSSGRGLIFLGNRRAATGRPHLMRVAQGHVLCFPPAVRLHHVVGCHKSCPWGAFSPEKLSVETLSGRYFRRVLTQKLSVHRPGLANW